MGLIIKSELLIKQEEKSSSPIRNGRHEHHKNHKKNKIKLKYFRRSAFVFTVTNQHGNHHNKRSQCHHKYYNIQNKACRKKQPKYGQINPHKIIDIYQVTLNSFFFYRQVFIKNMTSCTKITSKQSGCNQIY